nr:uncharacterized protein LOC119625345 [Chlorocebus sabaeus]
MPSALPSGVGDAMPLGPPSPTGEPAGENIVLKTDGLLATQKQWVPRTSCTRTAPFSHNELSPLEHERRPHSLANPIWLLKMRSAALGAEKGRDLSGFIGGVADLLLTTVPSRV